MIKYLSRIRLKSKVRFYRDVLEIVERRQVRYFADFRSDPRRGLPLSLVGGGGGGEEGPGHLARAST